MYSIINQYCLSRSSYYSSTISDYMQNINVLGETTHNMCLSFFHHSFEEKKKLLWKNVFIRQKHKTEAKN